MHGQRRPPVPPGGGARRERRSVNNLDNTESQPLLSSSQKEDQPTKYAWGTIITSAVLILALFAVSIGAVVYYTRPGTTTSNSPAPNEQTNVISTHDATIQSAVDSTNKVMSPAIDQSYVCELTTGSEHCSHGLTAFEVPSSNGRWPANFYWLIIKDRSKDSTGTKENSIIHQEKGVFLQADNIKCSKYVSRLCINGDNILYTNGKQTSGLHVNVADCQQKAYAEMPLEIRIHEARCEKFWTLQQEDLLPHLDTIPVEAEKKTVLQLDSSSNDDTLEPTLAPTLAPTLTPTLAPTLAPTPEPTAETSASPTFEPTPEPSSAQTSEPTIEPTFDPTLAPTLQPSISPTPEPSPEVSAAPTPEGTHYSLLIVLAHQWILHTSMSFINLYVSKTKRE